MALIKPIGAFRNGYDPRRTGGFKKGHPCYTPKESFKGSEMHSLDHYKPEEHQKTLEKYPLKDGLAHKHKNFVRALVAGESCKDAGDAVGWGTHHAQIMARHPKIVAYRQELEKKIENEFIKKQSDVEVARALLREASPKAAELLVQLMKQTQDEDMQRKCSVDILKGTKALDAEISEVSTKPAIVIAGAMLSSIEKMVEMGILSKGAVEQEKPAIDVTPTEVEPPQAVPSTSVTIAFPRDVKAAFGDA